MVINGEVSLLKIDEVCEIMLKSACQINKLKLCIDGTQVVMVAGINAQP